VHAAVIVEVVVAVFTTIPVLIVMPSVNVVYVVTGCGNEYLVKTRVLHGMVEVAGCRTVEPVLVDVVTEAICGQYSVPE
jgi:hypothetical protein